MRSKNRKGFTLVELVVVIAIIGVLSAILVPAIMGWIRRSREKQIIGNTKSILDAAAASVAFAYTDEDYGSIMTETYNGQKCAVITSYDMQQAQNGERPTTIDGRIARAVLETILPNGDAFSFADYAGGSNGPMGQTLDAYMGENPNTPGLVMILNDSGEIARLEYSMGNLICVFDEGYHVYADDADEAVFTSV